ncbi:MAG: hypothetical protein AAF478_09600 [Pseudomonadota bacterium]
MNKYIYIVFEKLASYPEYTGIHFNIWIWLILITSPLLIFRLNVERSILTFFIAIVSAVALTYLLLNLSLHTRQSLNWIDYVNCQKDSIHDDMSPEQQAECGHHVNKADGAQLVFTLLYGWVPAVIYAGFWELVWRIWRRNKIRNAGENYRGRWFSNAVILMGLFFALVIFGPFLIW